MARGKFNKRGGGKRVDAQSADEIEQRNQRLAEFEENRAKRRAEEEEAENGGDDEDGGGDEEGGTGDSSRTGDKPKPTGPVQVTTEADHKKNLAKLEQVKKRREQAEARRKAEQEAELAQEMERKARIKALAGEDGDDDGKKKKKSKSKELPKLSKIEIKKMKPAQMKDGECDSDFEQECLFGLERGTNLCSFVDALSRIIL